MANFGGPRDSGEIVSFLRALLSDQDVIRTPFPRWFHRGMFGLIAWIRGTFKARKEYATMGEGKGGSPIVGTTEKLATAVRGHSGCEILTFHRYNPRTHAAFFKKIHEMDGVGNIRICTLFPQFSYSTVGSIARMFQERLDHMQHNETCVLIIPIAFTQDHLETEFEMEHEYMPEIREHGVDVHRINALNVDPDWVEALAEIMVDEQMYTDDFSTCIYSWKAQPQCPSCEGPESDEKKPCGSPPRSRL